MNVLSIETEYPNMLTLVNMCMIDDTESCLLPSDKELSHIFAPMLGIDSYEREKMAARLIKSLKGMERRKDLVDIVDNVWKARKEELELNKKLYEECVKAEVDYANIEELLKMGANPVGVYDDNVWGNTVFSDVVNDRTSKEELPILTKLFLKYKMDINSTINNCLHTLTWVRDKYGFETMKLIFGGKPEWEDVEGYVGDMIGDMWQFEEFYLDNVDSMESLFWAIRETMYLSALVADNIEKCEWVYRLIRPDRNRETSLKDFLEWNNFDYEYIVNEDADEFSKDRLWGKTILIRRKGSSDVAWRIEFEK